MSDSTQIAAEIVSAYVSNNSVPAVELPDLISAVGRALDGLGQEVDIAETVAPVPAVPVKKSVHRDYLVSLETGERFQTLRKHLSGHGMTPDDYRAKWGLSADYPMTAPAYSERRSALAKSLGLGRKPTVAQEEVTAPKRSRTKPKQRAEAEASAETAQEAA